MSRFRFPLATLLRVKELREQIAEGQVARARHDLEACRAEQARLQSALDEVAGQLEQSLGTAWPGSTWSNVFEHSARLGRALDAARLRVQSAEQALRQALEVRTRIASEVEMLVTLRQQYRQAHREQEQAVEQQRLDELGMRQWGAAQRSPGKGP